MSDYPPNVIFKKAHEKGCEGELYRLPNTVTVDRAGRIGNGGWVAHDYRCNRSWSGCPARVLVTERFVRSWAAGSERRP